MTWCEPVLLHDRRWKCSRCGYISRDPTVQSDMARIRRPCRGAKLPSLGRQVMNYAQNTAAHAAGGFEIVTPDEHEARLNRCRECENGVLVEQSLRCKHPACGCFLEAKAWRKTSVCPLGKWPA